MRQYQLHIPAADAAAAETIADAVEAAFVEAGPVSWYETDGGWAVDGFFFADDAEEILTPARAALDGIVDDFRLNWVWMPPWGPDRITDDGREMLRALGFNV